MNDFKLTDEDGRIAALRRYQVLDTAEERGFEQIVELVRMILGTPIVAVSLVDAQRQWFKARCGIGVRETSREISFCTHAIRTRAPLQVCDTLEDPLFQENPLVLGEPYIRSYLGAQLRTPDGYNVGTLCAMDTRPRRYDSNQQAILKSLADLVVGELELRTIAARDAATGALTRRAWLEQARAELERCRRYGRSSAVALLDIDGFHGVNERFGRAAGDAVLQSVAALCASGLRESDVVGRVAGGQFALLFRETTAGQALIEVERIRQALALREVGLGAERVTISGGVVGCPRSSGEAAEWLASARDGAGRARAVGPNRSVLVETAP